MRSNSATFIAFVLGKEQLERGVGLPEGFSVENASGLGLQIVRTLVEAELLGSIDMGNRDDSWGTSVRIIVPLRGRS